MVLSLGSNECKNRARFHQNILVNELLRELPSCRVPQRSSFIPPFLDNQDMNGFKRNLDTSYCISVWGREEPRDLAKLKKEGFTPISHALTPTPTSPHSASGLPALDPDCYLITGHIRDYFLSRSSHRRSRK